MNQLINIVEVIDASAPIATGTTDQFSSIVDTSGADGVMFVARLGSPAANNILSAQQNSLNQAGGMADLASSGQAAGSSNLVVCEVSRPQKRYVRARVQRGTTTTIDSIMAFKYNIIKQPATQPASTVGKAVVAPAEGTP